MQDKKYMALRFTGLRWYISKQTVARALWKLNKALKLSEHVSPDQSREEAETTKHGKCASQKYNHELHA